MFNEEKIRKFIEPKVFGVCSYLGEKLGISSSIVRLYFIYITFIAFWSPILIYIFFAFWINVKDYIKAKVSPVREL